jgi:hypothetical protein
MRTLICILAAMPLAHATIGPDDTETPRSITVQFATGDATFNLLDGVVQTIDFHVRGKLYSAHFIGCTPLEHVRFDTAKFFNGIRSGRREGSFILTFQMGTEESRAFGQLPMVQISITDGRVSLRGITRATGEHSGFTSPLCRDERTT